MKELARVRNERWRFKRARDCLSRKLCDPALNPELDQYPPKHHCSFQLPSGRAGTLSNASASMAVDPVASRLQFLRQAAHTLAIPSPTISASLGSARDYLLAQNDGDIEATKKEWDALRREICGACGNVMVPGWSCKPSFQPRKPRKKDAPSRTEKHIVYSCARCDHATIQPVPSRQPKHMRPGPSITRSQAPQDFAPDASVNEQGKVTKSANATSKQRKKARKGGLQAMLQKDKTLNAAQGGLGLDLMDFMH